MRFWWLLGVTALPVWGCSDALPVDEVTTSEPEQSDFPGGVRPIPVQTDLDQRVVELGDLLFHDKRLSADNTLSCAGCHDLASGGVDGRRVSVGIKGAVGPINAPTVFNSGFGFRQFWDGRAPTLEEQVNGPTHAAGEMGSSWPEIIGKLEQDEGLTRRFREVFSDGWTPGNIRTAIATFERSLLTPGSAFDRFLQGDTGALSENARTGWDRFQNLGCIACHQGVALGGNMFQRFGVLGNYFEDRGGVTEADLGRYNVTGRDGDRHVFKVPSLRNVAKTAPYFHDGSAQTLEEAISVMARYQLGRELSQEDRSTLFAFLESLTGKYQGQPL